jgi:hypothetical protein
MRTGEVYINSASGERDIFVLGTDETGGKRVAIDLYPLLGGGMVGRQWAKTTLIYQRTNTGLS